MTDEGRGKRDEGRSGLPSSIGLLPEALQQPITHNSQQTKRSSRVKAQGERLKAQGLKARRLGGWEGWEAGRLEDEKMRG